MAVYVDRLRGWETQQIKPEARKHGQTWCHMVADTTAELDGMARAIGILPAWKQHPGKPLEHYDLTPGKRAQAIAAGAIELDAKQRRELLPLKVTLFHEAVERRAEEGPKW